MKKSGDDGCSIDGPQCHAAAGFHDYRPRTVLGFGGHVFCSRAYYYCRSCGEGVTPWDQQVGLTNQRQTPAVTRLATLCGAVADSFQKGAELLAEASGVTLSAPTVARATRATGEHIAHVLPDLGAWARAEPWVWHKDALGRTVGYISLDATGVPQQGPGGDQGARSDGPGGDGIQPRARSGARIRGLAPAG